MDILNRKKGHLSTSDSCFVKAAAKASDAHIDSGRRPVTSSHSAPATNADASHTWLVCFHYRGKKVEKTMHCKTSTLIDK